MTEVLEQEQNLRDKIKEYDTLYSNYQESHEKLKDLEENVLPSIERVELVGVGAGQNTLRT